MKKITSLLVFGFMVISVVASGFILSDKNLGSQDKKDKTQGNQLQKEGVVEKANYTCPMHPEVVQDKPGKCTKCKMNLVKNEVVKADYTCTMHPKVLQDKPGKCPGCKMNLVKKEFVEAVYTCPMHSDVVKHQAGKCPQCKMTLEKKEPVKTVKSKTI